MQTVQISRRVLKIPCSGFYIWKSFGVNVFCVFIKENVMTEMLIYDIILIF